MPAAKISSHKKPACGLCGNTKNLTKTECCGQWICDDEEDYVIFSYAKNSCYRNHQRYTLCGFHSMEQHPGRWQDCPQCREAFETELYVYYATNEFNFEPLKNPPPFEPTTCHVCGRVIQLGYEGYSQSSKGYTCGKCTAEKMGRSSLLPTPDSIPADSPEPPESSDFPDFAALLGLPQDKQEADPNSPGAQLMRAAESVEFGDLNQLKQQISDVWRPRFDDLIRLLDDFCDEHLNDEYKAFCHDMATCVCQDGSPANKGKVQSWAAGIVYALGGVNFLGDPSQQPHMKSKQIAAGFGVSAATMQAKCKILREGLDLFPFNPDWTVSSMLDANPLVWMIVVNGIPLDIREAPREIQVEAYENGLIPYIPADRDLQD